VFAQLLERPVRRLARWRLGRGRCDHRDRSRRGNKRGRGRGRCGSGLGWRVRHGGPRYGRRRTPTAGDRAGGPRPGLARLRARLPGGGRELLFLLLLVPLSIAKAAGVAQTVEESVRRRVLDHNGRQCGEPTYVRGPQGPRRHSGVLSAPHSVHMCGEPGLPVLLGGCCACRR
jgi:hypothetical protein